VRIATRYTRGVTVLVRLAVFVTLLSSALAAPAQPAQPAQPPQASPAQPASFPLPERATETTKPVKGSDGRIRTFLIPRSLAVVVAETRTALTKGGWKITATGSTVIRLTARKDGKTWAARFTTSEAATLLVLTLPAS
jgi:hypothetical protein